MSNLRAQVLADTRLPDAAELIQQGRDAARHIDVGACPFLEQNNVRSETEYKTRGMLSGRIMRHAQIGYRSIDRSCRAYGEVYRRLQDRGCPLDRYGICLDWSMGYPCAEREHRPRGTGLILNDAEEFARLTTQAPVAPHFGDFVMGMPAAFENTGAALAAGATSIGNLGQYFTFRLPQWDDDVTTTAETLKAIALCAAQPVPILIHSNLDDGFAALFTDLACALGAVLLEQYIVDDLLGGTVSHCYGHTYTEPIARLAFQRALAEVSKTPGTMVYGNTTLYDSDMAPNYAGMGSYLLIDILAQLLRPSGHAINPVPVSEAQRIPDIEEIVDAHKFAHRLIERAPGFEGLIDTHRADAVATGIVKGARRFQQAVLKGFETGGINVQDPLEMLLTIRRLGARALEERFGPGEPDASNPRGRIAIYPAATISELERQAQTCADTLSDVQKQHLSARGLKVCVATTDVHEYGKMLVESALNRLGVTALSGGVCTDPEDLIAKVESTGSNVIAISTYNGIALDYIRDLNAELRKRDLRHIPVYVGGKLNQIVEPGRSRDTDLPVDVTAELRGLGALPCRTLGEMLLDLAEGGT